MPEHTICATEVTQGLAGEGGKQKVRMLLVLCLALDWGCKAYDWRYEMNFLIVTHMAK